MIVLNTHARTGSYLAYQLVLRNLVLSEIISRDDEQNIINAVANSLWGTDLPTYFNHLKNPPEPFAGISLDNINLTIHLELTIKKSQMNFLVYLKKVNDSQFKVQIYGMNLIM